MLRGITSNCYHNYMWDFLIVLFGAYISILPTSLENSEWRTNIHGVEEHEVGKTEIVEIYYEKIQKLVHGL